MLILPELLQKMQGKNARIDGMELEQSRLIWTVWFIPSLSVVAAAVRSSTGARHRPLCDVGNSGGGAQWQRGECASVELQEEREALLEYVYSGPHG